MTERDLWWAVDCPKCGGTRLIERQTGELRPPRNGLALCGNPDCRTGILLDDAEVYLFDRAGRVRVDPDSLELDE